MNKSKVITELQTRYPGKKIICLPEDNPSEILCEVVTTEESPDKSVAISIIDRSVPHIHHHTTETYEIMSGELSVFIEDVEHKLKPGDTLSISPEQNHYAVGDETWIKCTASPGWTASDHIIC